MKPISLRGVRTAASLLALLGSAHAQFPVEDMGPRSLGLAYNFALRGQDITEAEVGSHEVIHRAVLAYAPIPYLLLHGSLGMDRFSVEPYGKTRFRGDYGLASSLGVSGWSPAFALDYLRVAGGVDLQTLGSEDGRGFRYSALVLNPFLGLVVSPTVFLNIAFGGRGHLVDGNMRTRGGAEGQSFGNPEIFRGYLALTLKTPFEKAFLHADLDFSPSVDSDWSNGPREATVSLSLGALLDWKGKTQQPEGSPTFFPAYQEMKDRQKKMAEELE